MRSTLNVPCPAGGCGGDQRELRLFNVVATSSFRSEIRSPGRFLRSVPRVSAPLGSSGPISPGTRYRPARYALTGASTTTCC